MSIIEWAAAGISLVAVLAAVYRSIATFLFGIAGAALYGLVFFDANLYANAALQLFFIAVLIEGWRHWRRNADDAGEVEPRRLAPHQVRQALTAVTAAVMLIGTALSLFTNSPAPLTDAAASGLALVAQLLQARRFIENWVLWVICNALSAMLFVSQGLWVTAALYSVFLVLAVLGWRAWSGRLAPR